MQVVRLINIRHYDPARGRFTSEAFRKYHAGISVVSVDCIRSAGRSICEHIRQYYSSTAGDPPIFWIFSTDDLPEAATVVQETSTSGDDCHYDIRGLTSGQERRFFQQYHDRFELFRLCEDDGAAIAPTREELDRLALERN